MQKIGKGKTAEDEKGECHVCACESKRERESHKLYGTTDISST